MVEHESYFVLISDDIFQDMRCPGSDPERIVRPQAFQNCSQVMQGQVRQVVAYKYDLYRPVNTQFM